MLERQDTTQSKFIDMLAYQVGLEAYIFGFPLVLMDVTRSVFAANSPINQFVHMRAFPDERCTDLVRPNVDTLYSFCFLDLSGGPILLSVPDMGDRYYSIQLMDAWTNIFASLGSRTTGNRNGCFVIVGPGWTARLPVGIPPVHAPTNLAWVSGRTQTNSTEDYPVVHHIQNHYQLTPLDHLGARRTFNKTPSVEAAIDVTTPPLMQVAQMDPEGFLNRMTSLMVNNPPSIMDDQIVRGLVSLGITPSKPLKLARMKKAIAQGIEAGCRKGFEEITEEARSLHGRIVNGWQFSEDLGRYKSRYRWRAAVATCGLGASLQEDIVCARAAFDASGAPLHGSNRYQVHFPSGKWPPVHAFWSLTIYDDQQHFLMNPIGRFAIGSRDNLGFNSDGSLSLYIQRGHPGREKESNWLPTPQRNFSILLRLYWPTKTVLNGSWKPPQVTIVAAEARACA